MELKFTENKCWYIQLLQKIIIFFILIAVILFEAILEFNIRYTESVLFSILGAALLLYVLDIFCSKNIMGHIYIDENEIVILRDNNIRERYRIGDIDRIICSVGDYKSYLPYSSIMPHRGNNTYLSFEINGRVYNLRLFLEDRIERAELKRICKTIAEQKRMRVIDRIFFGLLLKRLFKTNKV